MFFTDDIARFNEELVSEALGEVLLASGTLSPLASLKADLAVKSRSFEWLEFRNSYIPQRICIKRHLVSVIGILEGVWKLLVLGWVWGAWKMLAAVSSLAFARLEAR